MLRLVITGLFMVMVPLAFAQEQQGGMTTYREPSEAEINRQQGFVDENLKKGEDYFSGQTFKDSLATERAKISTLPSTLPGNRLDMPPDVMTQKWADRFNEMEAQANQAAKAPLKGDNTPMVFASLSMPREALKQLAAEAHRAGGVVIFRGLKDDDFIAMRKELVGLGEGFAIDPTLFARFAIVDVPTFVLPVEPVMPCDDSGCPAVNHVKVSGNVTLDGALDYMRLNSSEKRAKELADNYLKRLRDK